MANRPYILVEILTLYDHLPFGIGKPSILHVLINTLHIIHCDAPLPVTVANKGSHTNPRLPKNVSNVILVVTIACWEGVRTPKSTLHASAKIIPILHHSPRRTSVITVVGGISSQQRLRDFILFHFKYVDTNF